MKAYFASIPDPGGGKDVSADLQKSECYYENDSLRLVVDDECGDLYTSEELQGQGGCRDV